MGKFTGIFCFASGSLSVARSLKDLLHQEKLCSVVGFFDARENKRTTKNDTKKLKDNHLIAYLLP